MMVKHRLPRVEDFGNYWLGRRTIDLYDKPAGPAIFPSKRLDNGRAAWNGKYILFLDSDQGFVFKGGELKLFDSAMAALDELNKVTESTGE